MSIKNTTQVIRNARMALAEKVLEALNPASKKYLATRRAGGPSQKAYGNIPVNQDRQEARQRHRQGQGDGPTRPEPELDWGQLVAAKDKPEGEREKIAQNAKKKHKKDKNRWLRREGRIDRLNYSDRPSGDQSQNASTEIIRNARMALAEKVLSELSRSEEYRLSQGGDTTDDIKAERAKRRKADPKAQRYAPRGEKKEKGVKMHSVIPPRHSRIGRAGAKIAAITQDEKDARRRTYLARQQNASTEIVRNARIALAERVLSCLKEGDIDEGKRWDAVKRGARTAGLVTAAGAAGGLAGHALDKAYPGPWIGNKARAEAPAGPTHKPSKVGNNLSKEINFAADRMPENPLADKKPDTIKTLKRMWKEKDRQKHEQIKNSVLNYLSELSGETLQSYKDKITPNVAKMRGDKGLNRANTKLTKIAQGKNTPKSVFGGKSNQTSTTAGGGTLGSELAKTKPETQQSMNRRGTSTVDKKKVAANLADAKSGRNTASLAKEIAADNKKRAAKKRAEG